MWANRRERQRELRDLAGFFAFTKNPATAKWIRHLAMEIGVATPGTILEGDFRDTLAAWKSDFAGNDDLRKKRLDYITDYIFKAVAMGELNKVIAILLPILRELGENEGTLVPLAMAFEPFRRKGDRRMHFYEMCFHYALFVEGVFDEAIRSLFLLISSVDGESMSLAAINKLDLWKLRSEFQRLNVPDIFFQGWENRVRNSIAHCRFRYDNKLGKMRFKDVDPKGKQPDYDKSFTLEEFSELGKKVSDVYLIIQNTWFMLRIRQLILAPFVPNVGKNMLMPSIRSAVKAGILAGPVS
jgi:hypothetical protein